MKQQLSGIKILKKIKKQLTIAILFVGIAIVFLGCDSEIEKVQAFSSSENLPLVSAIDIETTNIDSFKVQSYMKAPLLKMFDSKDQSFIEFPNGVLLIRYDSNEEEISRITADYARNYEKEKKWEAKNNVVAVNSQGDTLKTELLIWDERNEKVYSDKFVRIIRSDQIITGIGFEADQSFQNWKIKNPKGTIYIELDQEGRDEQNIDSARVLETDMNRPLEFN